MTMVDARGAHSLYKLESQASELPGFTRLRFELVRLGLPPACWGLTRWNPPVPHNIKTLRRKTPRGSSPWAMTVVGPSDQNRRLITRKLPIRTELVRELKLL